MPFTVFISSTSRDLQDHRTAVERRLLDAGLHPIGMEHFSARAQEPLAACLDEVRDADLFVGVYGWRYGFVPGGQGQSITELEFWEAQRLKKPCFCFFVDPAFPWPEALRDQGDAAERLEAFKQRVDGILVRSTFSTPDDLAARVLASIQRYERSQARQARPSIAQTPEQRNLATLLERGKQFWVSGVLDHVAGNTGTYALQMAPEPDAVEQPWRDNANLPAPPVSSASLSILDIFEQSGRLLLILGEPGSGKTVTLLQLARHLMEQARENPAEPVPVVFHLGSWSPREMSLGQWLVLEARSKYYVSGSLFEQWLREQRIILLLDGLDEIRLAERAACVQGINDFVSQWGVPGIAVCARRDEYLSLPTRLKLNCAVTLQPLSAEQIEAILATSAQSGQQVQQLLHTTPDMAALAASPLMLNLMRASDPGSTDTAMHDVVPATPTDTILARYVEARLPPQKIDADRRQSVLTRLAWVARRTLDRGGNLFQIDALQPHHLRAIPLACYWLLTRIAVGLILGVTEGLYLSTVGAMNGMGAQWAPASIGASVWRGVSVGLVLGISAAAIEMVSYHWRSRSKYPEQGAMPRSHMIAMALCLFVVFVLSTWALWGSWERSGFGIVWALLFALRGAVTDSGKDIRTPDVRGWSWPSAAKGLAIGSAVGALIVIASTLGASSPSAAAIPTAARLWAGAFFSVFYGLLGAVFLGWRAQTIVAQIQVNEGIRLFRRSLRRAGLVLGVVSGGTIGLAVAIAAWSTGVAQAQGAGVAMVIIAGLVGGSAVGAYFAVIGALWYGGIDVINHYTLRGVLWLTGQTPLRLVRALDEFVELRLLRRIGSGYAFTHRMLLEYFAQHAPARR